MIQPLAMVIKTSYTLITRTAMFGPIPTDIYLTEVTMSTLDDVRMLVPKE